MKNSNASKIEEVLSQLGSIQANQAAAITSAVTNAMAAFYQKASNSRAELLPGVNP